MPRRKPEIEMMITKFIKDAEKRLKELNKDGLSDKDLSDGSKTDDKHCNCSNSSHNHSGSTD
jgi:hypothetical protein